MGSVTCTCGCTISVPEDSAEPIICEGCGETLTATVDPAGTEEHVQPSESARPQGAVPPMMFREDSDLEEEDTGPERTEMAVQLPPRPVSMEEARFPTARLTILTVVVAFTLSAVLLFYYSVLFAISPVLALLGLIACVAAYGAYTYMLVHPSEESLAKGAQLASERGIAEMTAELAEHAGLPTPTVVVDESDEVNAFTYGFARDSAYIHVNQGFLDHVEPNDDEMRAVIAHELGHIYNGDCVASTVMQFPLVVLNHIGQFLVFLFNIASAMFRVFGEVVMQVGGFVGLFMVFAGLMVLLYLATWIGITFVLIFICSLMLNAFSREREFVADAFSSVSLADPGPLQSALAKLKMIEAQIEESVAKKQENEEEIDPDEINKSLRTPSYSQALGLASSFARSRQKHSTRDRVNEWLIDHPYVERRVWALGNVEKPNIIDRASNKIVEMLDRFSGTKSGIRKGSSGSALALLTWDLYLGFAAGVVLVVLNVILYWLLGLKLSSETAVAWSWGIALLCAVGGAAYLAAGRTGRDEDPCGQSILRRSLHTALGMSYSAMVVFALIGHPNAAMEFPEVLALAVVVLIGVLIVSVRRLGRVLPETIE
jgi:Zn-dependent protease with chaperone function